MAENIELRTVTTTEATITIGNHISTPQRKFAASFIFIVGIVLAIVAVILLFPNDSRIVPLLPPSDDYAVDYEYENDVVDDIKPSEDDEYVDVTQQTGGNTTPAKLEDVS